MNSGRKSLVRKISLERMYRLIELAEKNAVVFPDRSKYYIDLLWKISKRNRVRIPLELKKLFCKKCHSFFVEGKNVETRVKKKRVLKKCLNCGKIKMISLKNKNKKLVIGITGLIAVGKSTVAGFFKEKGAIVFDADKIAKKILTENKKARIKLKKLFGEKVFENEKVLFEKIAEIVFANNKKLRELNSIVHPLVERELKKLTRNCEKKIVVWDVPLLFESGLHRFCDKIVLVECSKKEQFKRLKEKGFNEKNAFNRINARKFLKKWKNKVDFVINNNKGLKDLRIKSEIVWEKILRE
jgi:dephospho-CoA kinase